jgi:chaperonin cofactor prefoldin
VVARRAAEIDAETEGLRLQVHALEDKMGLLVDELHRLTERLVEAAEGQGTK